MGAGLGWMGGATRQGTLGIACSLKATRPLNLRHRSWPQLSIEPLLKTLGLKLKKLWPSKVA